MIRKLIDTPHRLLGVVVLLIVAGVGVLSVWAEGNRREPVAAAETAQFSAERGRAHLERFATEPRPLGSPASDRTQDYIAGQLRAAGFEVEIQHAVGASTAPGLAAFGRVDNVIATLPGRDPTGTVLVASHFDSAATGPGASDDGAAVAAMLEVGRLIGAQGGTRNNLVLLFTDGEEDGLLGAEAFVREHPLGRAGGVVLNWEARGVSGPSLMFETSRGNAELSALFAETVPDPRGDSSMVEIYRKLPNDTDFTEFREAGFDGLNFAYIEQPAYYHTAGDSLANLDPRSLQHHGENMLAMTRTLAAADLPALHTDRDATYFRIGPLSIHYPSALAWPLAALAAALVVGLAVVARRRELASTPRMVLAAVSVLLPLGAVIGLGQALWWLLVALRPGYHMMNGLLYRPEFYEAALAALAGTALLVWYLLLRVRLGPAALAIGALAWPAVLGLVCAAVAPGAAFLFTLPAGLAAAGALLAMLPVRWAGWPAVTLVAGLSISAVFLPVLARGVFDAVGLAYAGAGAACLALLGLLLLPAIELLLPEPEPFTGKPWAVPPTRAWAVPATVAVLGIAAVGAGLVVDTADPAHPQRSHLAYVLDAETGQAHWASAELHPTDWTGQYVRDRDNSGLPAGYARETMWTGPADPIDVHAPRVELRHRTGDTVTMHVSSPRGASSLILRFDRPIDLVTAASPGAAPVTVPVTGTRPKGQPGEIRFRDLPPEGAELTVRTPGADRVRVTAIDESHGLTDAPGFRPRPADTIASIRPDGDVMVVVRNYRL
ncbi:M28 family peptidase [Nocardia flavorosea]|uniref:M28 family peptidase n=1 Tax=Nocardia flavorosea TaxID=53429 RepID=UPI00189632F1|nr:M28 family peptidase [Nocardia flavorosea]MBF6351873.1 M28 family peptidase [Nocardia flavorosea]